MDLSLEQKQKHECFMHNRMNSAYGLVIRNAIMNTYANKQEKTQLLKSLSSTNKCMAAILLEQKVLAKETDAIKDRYVLYKNIFKAHNRIHHIAKHYKECGLLVDDNDNVQGMPNKYCLKNGLLLALSADFCHIYTPWGRFCLYQKNALCHNGMWHFFIQKIIGEFKARFSNVNSKNESYYRPSFLSALSSEPEFDFEIFVENNMNCAINHVYLRNDHHEYAKIKTHIMSMTKASLYQITDISGYAVPLAQVVKKNEYSEGSDVVSQWNDLALLHHKIVQLCRLYLGDSAFI